MWNACSYKEIYFSADILQSISMNEVCSRGLRGRGQMVLLYVILFFISTI